MVRLPWKRKWDFETVLVERRQQLLLKCLNVNLVLLLLPEPSNKVFIYFQFPCILADRHFPATFKLVSYPYETKLRNSREMEISREFPTVPEYSLYLLESLNRARQFSGILGGSLSLKMCTQKIPDNSREF